MSAAYVPVRIALAAMLGAAAVLGTSAAAMGAPSPAPTPAPSSSTSQDAGDSVTGGSTYPGDPKS